MAITFRRTTNLIESVEYGEDSPFVTSSLQLNLDASKLTSYPQSGSSWEDISDNTYNYTLSGDATFNSLNDGSINFQNGAKAISPNFGSNFSEDFTYEIWINPSSLTGNILSERDGGGWTVSLMGLVNGEVRIGGWTGGTSYISVGTITTGTWYQIVMKYSSGTLTGYINGVAENSLGNFSKQHPGGNYYATIADTEPTNFGDGGAQYSGKISSLKLYNTALSDAEILQMRHSINTPSLHCSCLAGVFW